MKPATKKSLRGRVAAGVNRLAMALAGGSSSGGYTAGKRDNRKLRSWRTGEGSPAADLLPDLPTLRGRSRDLERNSPLALGAIQTKVNGVVGTGLVLKSVLDAKVLGISNEQAIELQYQIEREWELFCAGCDYSGMMHFLDMQRLIYRSGRISGDIGIVRRFERRPGNPYGTKIVLIEADRIANPDRRADSTTLQAGVKLTESGRVEGYYFSNRHPGDLLAGALSWTYVPRVSASTGLPLMLLPVMSQRPGQMRGIPLFAPVEQALKQMGDYTDAEIHAAVNDALLFAFEMLGPADEDGEPLVTSPDSPSNVAGEGELHLEDLTITTLGNESKVEVKAPVRPNAGFGTFIEAFCKQVGVALELPFELLIMHFSASFSASRAAMELAWKGFAVDKAFLERNVCDPIREWQFTEMVASGRFDAPGFFDDPIKRMAWLGRLWIGPTRIQINPVVEANADKIDMEMKVKSRDQVITERTGGDFERKSAQILHEEAVLGLGPAAPAAIEAPVLPKPEDEQNGDGTDDKAAIDDQDKDK